MLFRQPRLGHLHVPFEQVLSLIARGSFLATNGDGKSIRASLVQYPTDKPHTSVCLACFPVLSVIIVLYLNHCLFNGRPLERQYLHLDRYSVVARRGPAIYLIVLSRRSRTVFKKLSGLRQALHVLHPRAIDDFFKHETLLDYSTIDETYSSVFQFRVLNSEGLPSPMREEVSTSMFLVGVPWNRWFRKHRGLNWYYVATLA